MRKLSLEERVIVLCSRVNLLTEHRIELKQAIKEGIKWGRLLELAIFNKVLPLVAFHFLTFTTNEIPGFIRKQFHLLSLGHRLRNEGLFSELKNVVLALEEHQIPYSLLKGAYLVPHVYKHYGIRLCNDTDVLIQKKDIQTAVAVLEDVGYLMGQYNDTSRKIEKATRSQDIFWKRHMGNVHPMVKVCDDPFLDYMCVDFAFDVNPVQGNSELASSMLSRVSDVKIHGFDAKFLHPEDFLIHVCTHLYKEACSDMAQEVSSRLNMIKFCDLRELVLVDWQDASDEQWSSLIKRIEEINQSSAVVYAFKCLSYLYEDMDCEKILLHFSQHQDLVGNPPEAGSTLFWNTLFPECW